MSVTVDSQTTPQTNSSAGSPNPQVASVNGTSTNALPPQYQTKKAMWERKLLDLGLRNQLINMRKSRTLIPLLTNTINELEDALADGEEFLITAKPEKLVFSEEEFKYDDLLKTEIKDEDLQKEFAKHHLYSSLTEGELKKAIKEVYRSAKSSIEENGANTLYLALGLLKWFESNKGNNPPARYAPIILYPIDIIRKSAAQGYTICLRDDDPQLNITLLEKLKQDFRIEVEGLDPLPLDEHGLDTRKIFDTIREYAKHQENWEVLEIAAVGIFSFTQFVMWNDLTNRSDDLIKNKIVKSLLEGKLTWEAETMETGDHVCEDDVFMAMPTDASQLFAVRSACENKSFVLHGPPGTGKSQTITSLIANALGQNKTVLFVAEKMAALEVVQKRLSSIGLAPFCLELHSNKSRKKAVLEKLQQTTEFRRPKASEEYKQKAEEISKLRKELDIYSEDLHKKQSYGLSIYQLINDYELNANFPDIPAFSSEALESITAELLNKQSHAIESLINAARAVGHPAEHALSRVGCTEYNQSLKDELNSKTEKYLNALEKLHTLAVDFQNKAGLTDIKDDLEWSKLLTTAEQVAKWSYLPKAWADHKGMNICMTEMAEMADHFIKSKELRADLEKNWKPEFFDQNGSELSTTHTQKSNSWFIPRFFGLWSLKSKVSAFAKASVNADTLGTDLSNLSLYQSEKAKADELFKKYTAELDSLYNGENTDWNKVRDYANAARESSAKLNELYNDEELRIKLCSNKELTQNACEVEKTNKDKITVWEEFAKVAQPKPVEQFKAPIAEDLKMCSSILKHVEEIKEWVLWNQTAKETEDSGLAVIVEAYQKGMDHDDILGAYKKAISKGLASRAIDASKTLNSFSGKLFDQKVDRFITLDKQISELGNREIVYRLAAKLPDFTREAAQSSELGILQRAIKSGGRGTSLRKLFGQIPNILPRLCPCMLMSPISVAQYIDPNKSPFDLVIFDEASQLTTSKAVGVLARGQNAVIVGDPKQMPPTSFFSSAAVDEDNLDLEDMESILDDCLALNMPQTHLLWHYRSKHESLIAFSNHNFYESKLFTFPSVDDRESKVNFVHVKGTFDHGSGKRYNKEEAEAVVKELIRRSKDPKLSKYSVGVVTFNIPQQNLIDDLFTEACKNDLELESWAYKKEDPLFIKNLENVQGDERDVIIFSVGYGPDKEGKVSMNFGPLNKDGGWRRLNVAVSRSKREMMVFSSMLPEHIDTNKTKAEGVIALRNFLDFARNPKGYSFSAAKNATQNGIIKSLSKILKEQGYAVDTNIGNSEFKVDLGVIDPRNENRYLLGILLDGPVYAECKTTRDRELSQASVLRGLGWNIIRMWSMDWWENKDIEVDKLLDTLDKLKNAQPIEPEKKEDPKEELKPVEYEEPGTASTSESGIFTKPYTATQLPVTSLSSDDFMARKNATELKKRALQVIKTEAPITEGLLTKRLIQSYGITRVGTRVQAYLDEFYANLSLKVTKQSDGQKIYWTAEQNPDDYSDCRAGKTDADKRDSKDIPIIEAANAVYKIVSDQIALSPDDLAKEAAKQLGFSRLGTNLTTLMEAAVEFNKAAGYLTVAENGNITLNKTEN
ncbi:MAG: DUF3320 domain-containing protein [Candidatus Riflebacteria bacterium]|nr:DUF3320 domain-containing protein [Candidatus Riflebacteria bacterium]